MAKGQYVQRFVSLKTMTMNDVRYLAARLEAHPPGKRIILTEQSTRMIVQALRLYADLVDGPRDEWGGYQVEVWNDKGGIEEVLARSSHGIIARAAFDEACIQRPRAHLTLRQGIRTIAERSKDDQKR